MMNLVPDCVELSRAAQKDGDRVGQLGWGTLQFVTVGLTPK